MNWESPHPLSPSGRNLALSRMASTPVDLLVIGGGITGAGVARDAALRGMRVALVEKADFAQGTSSRSSKIVHGGVRYLEYLQIGLVRESARERRILEHIAPHLVHPIPFLYPVFGGESLLKIRAGLKLFDHLASTPPGQRSRCLSPRDTRVYLPGLREPLKGAVLYPEYITDDARFTLANIASAAGHGALVANHAQVSGFLFEGVRVVGARVRDIESGGEFEVRAGVTVNATGPWAQELLEAGGLPVPKRLIPSKGIHILLERRKLPLKAATFLRSSTGRRGLAMPRGPWVYVGTSDTEYREKLDRPRAHADEVAELLEMTRDSFPEAGLESDDVKGYWAGIRPLIFEEGRSTRDTSRHDEVWISPPGLVTVAGGKLTTYRPMARRILARVAEARGEDLPGEELTAISPLPGAPNEDIAAYRVRMRGILVDHGLAPEVIERLEFLYGTEVETLLEFGREDAGWLDRLSPSLPALRGEVRLAVEREMALRLTDVLDRRLALLLFSHDGGESGIEEAAAIMGALLGWSEGRRAQEIGDYREVMEGHRPIL